MIPLTPLEVVTNALTWVGVRYKHQGRSRIGIDCIGLVGCNALELGLPEAEQWLADPESRGYGREPDRSVLNRLCGRYLSPLDAISVGCILLLIVPPHESPRHFAIVVSCEPLRVVHAYARGPRQVTHTALPLSMRIATVFGYRGVAWHP